MFIDLSMTRESDHHRSGGRDTGGQREDAPYQFHSLPVIDADRVLVGIVTDRDVRSAWPSDLFSEEETLRQKER